MKETIFYIFLPVVGALLLAGFFLRARLRVPSRHYEGPASVSSVYDRWTQEGVLEFYWGEHLHAGYYGDPPVKKDFVTAKIDMIEAIIHWGIARPASTLLDRLEGQPTDPPSGRVSILDVGCGLGGSTRYLAKRWPKTAYVTGITISNAQARHATALACDQGVGNAGFLECDALDEAFADASFDIVWAVESEMHMPDKEAFLHEIVRVLKPGGMLLIAAWNVRDTREAPLSKTEAAHLRLLVDEWCHAEFTSIRDYIELFQHNNLVAVTADNWAEATQPSWRQAVWVAMRNPRGMLKISMKQRWGLMRDAYTILRFDTAFRKGLCEYGLIRGQKAGVQNGG